MAVPMKNGGMSKTKVIFYVILSGITTGVGAFFGAIIGSISQTVIAVCLSFAAGAMLYIVSGELIPESNKLYNGRMSAKKCLKKLWKTIDFINAKLYNLESKKENINCNNKMKNS